MNRWVLLSLVVGIMGVSGGWYVYAQPSSPFTEVRKHKALVALLGREPRLEAARSNNEWIAHQGKFFTLSYPAAASRYDRPNENIENNPNLLEFWRADILEPRLTMTVQVWQKPVNTTLEEFPAVALRQTKGNIYSENTVTIDGQNGILFSRTDTDDAGKYEQVGFTEYSNRIYVIAITAADRDTLTTTFEHIIPTIKLK